MAKVTEVRLTLAAFIYGIEIDAKAAIKKYIVPFNQDVSFFKNQELQDKVIERYNSENPGNDYLNNLDYKLIKNFCDHLYKFLQIVPNTEVDGAKSFIRDIIIRNDKYLSFTLLRPRIIIKYADKFHDETVTNCLDFDLSIAKKIGNVVINDDERKQFVFIESEKNRYYANRFEFLDISSREDWQNLKHRQLVSFEIGTNSLGECAVNVRLL